MQVFRLSSLKTLPFDFEAEVKKFVQAKKDHLMTEGVPAPTAHPVVEASVRRIPGTIHTPDDFVADYSIIDDTPPPPTLDERKSALATQVNDQVTALTSQIAPPLKQKLFQFQVNDATSVPEADRTNAQKAVIADFLERDRKLQGIYRHAAELESQIHDLTDATIDGWKPAPFPE